MTITFASCCERPAGTDIDPLLTGFHEELSPKLVCIGSSAVDIPFWVEDSLHHADHYLPPHSRIRIARDDTRQAVGWGALRQIRPDAGEMKRLCVRHKAHGQGTARRPVQARIDDARTMGWLISSPTPSVTISRCRRSIIHGFPLHRPVSRKRRRPYIERLCVDPEIHATRPLTPQ